jgi:hypothetical protein
MGSRRLTTTLRTPLRMPVTSPLRGIEGTSIVPLGFPRPIRSPITRQDNGVGGRRGTKRRTFSLAPVAGHLIIAAMRIWSASAETR